MRLLPYIFEYNRQGFLFKLIESVYKEKTGYILCATTRADMEEILKPSVPFYNFNTVVPKNKFHVEAEELILWSMASVNCKLKTEGVVRFQYLFEKILGEEAKNVFNRG